MNFGDILDEWNRRSPAEENFLPERETESENRKLVASIRRSRLLKKSPDAVLDLHSLNQQEAWTALEDFFNQSKEQGFEKLQIIHGKGNHNGSEGVLREVTRKFIEYCPFAGESGYGFGADGGRGTTWVLIKNN